MNWNKYPFLRLLIPLIVGVFLFEAVGPVDCDKTLLFAILVALLCAETMLSRLLKTYRYRWLFGVQTMLVFAFLGYYRSCLQDVTLKEDHYGKLTGTSGYYLARVYDPPIEKDKSVKVLLQLEGCRKDSLDAKISGKVRQYSGKYEEVWNMKLGE